MIIFLSLLICLIGLFIYLFASNAKVAEVGKCMFWVGLLAFLFGYHGQVVGLLR